MSLSNLESALRGHALKTGLLREALAAQQQGPLHASAWLFTKRSSCNRQRACNTSILHPAADAQPDGRPAGSPERQTIVRRVASDATERPPVT